MPRKPLDADWRGYAQLKGDGLVFTHPRRAPGGEGGVWGNAPRFTGAVQAPEGADLAPFGGELIRLICVAM